MNNQRLARKIDQNQSTINDLMDELVEEIESLESEVDDKNKEILELQKRLEEYEG